MNGLVDDDIVSRQANINRSSCVVDGDCAFRVTKHFVRGHYNTREAQMAPESQAIKRERADQPVGELARQAVCMRADSSSKAAHKAEDIWLN